ncbi:MAG: P-loop NTPase fold protein [Methanospirillum sp.]
MSSLSPDAPQTDPKDDRFGVAPFAVTLADGLLKMFQPEGFVVALHGEWGSGKTTVLNFVRHNLDKYNKTLKEEKKPITIIDFNPWWFSGREDLTRQFFEAFGMGLSKKWEDISILLETVGSIADTVSPIRIPAKSVAEAVKKWKDPKRKSVRELKQKVNEILGEKGRVLVIIDDIDRLTDSEIRQVFQVIKAIGDFSNVVYLLAYDPDVVRNSLKGAQGNSRDNFGGEYLEKIIQASFDIPDPTAWDLYQLFLQEFSQILRDDNSLINKQRERKVIERIVSFLGTPRKITRFLNAFRLSYSAVEDEVNPIDFAGIEAIRTLAPSLYHYIQKNEELFLRSYPFKQNLKQKEDLEENFSDLLDGFPQQSKNLMIDLVRLLFPAINAVLEGKTQGLGTDAERAQLKDRRVCSKEKFPIYFRWSLPEGGISSKEFDSILKDAGDPVAFGNRLRVLKSQKRLTGEPRLDEFLYHLDANLDQIPLKEIPSVLQAFAQVGDTILPVIEESGKYSWAWKNSSFFGQIFIDITRKVNRSERLPLLIGVVSTGNALLLLSEITSAIGRQQGWYKKNKVSEDECLLTEEQFEEFKFVFVKRVQRAADEGSLIGNIGLFQILQAWNEASPSSIESIRQWAKVSVQDPNNLVRFIDGFYLPQVSSDPSLTQYDLASELLWKIIDPTHIQEKVLNLPESISISDHQRDALKAFSRAYGEYREVNR